MNRVFPLAIIALAILAFATLVLVVAPGLQVAALGPTPGLRPYTAQQLRGRAQYVGLGCVYCHSQQPRSLAQAPDAARGWGRAAVASDYYYDRPHLLGTMRSGPDLFNIGVRLPSQGWHLTHLYQPRAIAPWSIMPAYPFLFEHKDKAGAADVVVALPPPFAPGRGVIVARPEALDLVAYLQALKHTEPAPATSPRDEGYTPAGAPP